MAKRSCGLMVEMEVVGYLIESKTAATRNRFFAHFEKIAANPAAYRLHQERDSTGRQIDSCLFMNHAVIFWEDPADMYVKILEVRPPTNR
jgi:hypothetical protein